MHNTKHIKPAKAELPWWKGRGAAGWELRRLSMLGFQNEPWGTIWEPVPTEASPSPLTFLLFYFPVLSLATPCFTFYASKYGIAPTHLSCFMPLCFGSCCSFCLECLSTGCLWPSLQNSPVIASPLIRSLGSHSALEMSTSEKLSLPTEILSVSVTLTKL